MVLLNINFYFSGLVIFTAKIYNSNLQLVCSLVVVPTRLYKVSMMTSLHEVYSPPTPPSVIQLSFISPTSFIPPPPRFTPALALNPASFSLSHFTQALPALTLTNPGCFTRSEIRVACLANNCFVFILGGHMFQEIKQPEWPRIGHVTLRCSWHKFREKNQVKESPEVQVACLSFPFSTFPGLRSSDVSVSSDACQNVGPSGMIRRHNYRKRVGIGLEGVVVANAPVVKSI